MALPAPGRGWSLVCSAMRAPRRIASRYARGRDGTTHIVLEPLDLIARLAVLVPKPRVNLTRFHGVFAPNSVLRAPVTRRRCGRRNDAAKTPAQRRAAMTWAQRLNRVFRIDIETCRHGGGALRMIAGI